MKNSTGPWALVRHMWARNFRQNPVGTVAGSVLAAGGVGLMLFFGFFIVVTLIVVGGLFMLAQSIFGAPRGSAGWPDPSTRPEAGEASRNPGGNNALEGEYTVVPEQEQDDK